MKKLENKIAIITGGADGIGKATVEKFASEGAVVIVWDLNEEKGNETVESISKNGGKAEFMKVNTAVFAEVEEATKKTVEKHGTLDIIINNAGITRDASIKKMTSELWQQVIDVNLTGVFNCCKCASDVMVEKGYGRIINASSVVALYGNFGQTNYVATKAGLIGMTKTLAKELGRKGITVNAVAPGFIATEMVKKMPSEVLKSMEEKVPVKRLGLPEEIASAYLFLASDDAAYINGAVLSVDGGITI
ncbi:3-oxoacyl-(acyl-carrier-protein) reductase FabG [uncultured Paludibacter sp.]|uniref:3-oxoacyl-[acyl-carrier-protein] reductase FabG n=1 Tax=uncultured Paludibacter sp. TaxID=497635 RepID=A0A653A622_9BACT|nr:3-oxoacyl-(acyl-carrier-protein) reductase FabG [uncultured Paludibacter sp.]